MRAPFIGLVAVLAATMAGCAAWILPPAPEVPLGPPANCLHTPLGGFHDVWSREDVWPRLGCAMEAAEPITGTEALLCCDLRSIWIEHKRLFVILDDSTSRWTFLPDESGLPAEAMFVTPTWVPTPGSPQPTPPTAAPTPTSPQQPVSATAQAQTPSPTLPSVTPLVTPSTPLPTVVLMTRGLTGWPPDPCFAASGRHAWVAGLPPWAERCAGLSATDETVFHGVLERFEDGWLLWDGNLCFVLFGDGTWRWL